jgi:phage tail protein X
VVDFGVATEKQYITTDGDVLDAICWAYYGRTQQVVEAVWLRNRDVLATYGPILPAGVLLVLPVVAIQVNGANRLWNYRVPAKFPLSTTDPFAQDTLEIVEAALEVYRAARDSGAVVVPTVLAQASANVVIPPEVETLRVGSFVYIGSRARFVQTDVGVNLELIDPNTGAWVKQNEWKPT